MAYVQTLFLCLLILLGPSHAFTAEPSGKRELYLKREVLAFPELRKDCWKARKLRKNQAHCGDGDTMPLLPLFAKLTILDSVQYDEDLRPVPRAKMDSTSSWREMWFKVRYSFERQGKEISGEGWVYAGSSENPHEYVGFRDRKERPRSEEKIEKAETKPKRRQIDEIFGKIWPRRDSPLRKLDEVEAKKEESSPRKADPPVPEITSRPTLPPLIAKARPAKETNPSVGGSILCDLHLMQANLVDMIRSHVKAIGFLHRLKPQDQLDRYVACHRWKENGIDVLKAYREVYKPSIQAAAEAFGIPPALLTCLIYRESWGFRPLYVYKGKAGTGGTSNAGAMGIGQFMNNTIAPINVLLRSKRLTREEEDKARAVVAKWRADNEKGKYPIRANYVYQVAKNRLMHEELRRNWEWYHKTIRPNAAVPWEFSVDLAYTPQVAIAATALYLKQIMLDLDAQVMEKRRYSFSREPNGDFVKAFLAVAAGLYNKGPGNNRALSNVNPPSISAWKQILGGKTLETRDHMESIERCMTKGEGKQPVWRDKNKREVPQVKPCDVEGDPSA